MEHRAGWDATLSAPKTVSLTALVGGDTGCARRTKPVSTSPSASWNATSRRGDNHAPETTGNWIAAKFEHDSARPSAAVRAPASHHVVVLI